jgi:hypothetical protein
MLGWRKPERLILPKHARRIGTDKSATSCHFEDRACAELSEVQRCRPRSGARDPQSAGRAVSCGLPLVVPPPRRMGVPREQRLVSKPSQRRMAMQLGSCRRELARDIRRVHGLGHSTARKSALDPRACCRPRSHTPEASGAEFLHHADPNGPVPARPCARAANGSLLSRQSDRITGLQGHRLEQPA